MAVEVKMPQMGESITEGTVVRWLVAKGDRIERDAPLLEISTDKVDSEVPSPQAGWVTQILVQDGETVPVDTPVCILTVEEPGAETGDSDSSTSTEPAVKPVAKKESPAPADEKKAPAKRDRAERLSPAVRRLVREHGVDVSQIRGTGEGGRVSRNDVLAYVERLGGASAGTSSAASSKKAPVERPTLASLEDRVESMSVMRRKIAEHMIESRRTSAHVSTIHEADFTEVRKLRDRLRPDFQKRGVKLTYLPFLAQAIARGLAATPELNASIVDDEIHYHGDVNLGVAVSIEDGLIVPVLRRAQDLSIFEIADGIRDLAERARSKKLQPDEVQGGTFTLTNPGVFGTLIGTPIIAQPQVGILCFGAVQKRVVVLEESDAIAIRSMSYLSLTFDHRLIDGAAADRFLQTACHTIESADFTIR